MKGIIQTILAFVWIAIVVSCADESLDPLQVKAVKKGTVLALRGEALQNIYVRGVPAAEIFPRIATGTEQFKFDAEYLSDDPTSLASMDIFVIKKVGSTRSRVAVKNVSAAEFKSDGTYPRPWVSVTLSLKDDILPKLDLPTTFPMDDATVTTLLETYSTGVAIEIDLNLTDGTRVLASELVAAGLYQSNQFYPAQKLTWVVTDYCSYAADSWAGDFDATETSEFFGVWGPYDISLVADGSVANRFTTDNWYDSGIPIYMDLTPSVDVATQVVTVPKQEYTTPSGKLRVIEATGTYNQCFNEMNINFTYKDKTSGEVVDAFVWKLVKK